MSDAIRFETPSDYLSALDTLLQSATHLIRIYDWDLADGGYESPARIELLKEFCRQKRTIKILLADDTYLRRHAGQMMRLLSVWGHALHVRVRDADPPPARDSFVLADDKGVLKRHDKDETRGLMRRDARGDAAELALRFDGEWDRASRRVSAHTLGL